MIGINPARDNVTQTKRLPHLLDDALNASGSPGVATMVNVLALAGLVASLFSIIFGYSRFVFALSRAGYLPRFLSLTGQRKTPIGPALVIPARNQQVLKQHQQQSTVVEAAADPFRPRRAKM